MRRRRTLSLPGIARRKTRVNALMTPQVGFTRLAALNAQLGQARVAVQSILLRKKMDARVNGVPADLVGGVSRPAPDGSAMSAIALGRREFILALGGAAAAPLLWPRAARAQQPAGKVWRVGILQPGAPPEPLIEATRQRLRELGYLEGRNVAFEYRWAEGKLDRLTDLATELAGSKVDVITTQSTPAALAARSATTTIPIVFTAVGDPVGAGVVSSLARPGGNATGISLLATELSAKRLEILREIVPGASRVAMLWNDTNPGMVLRAQEAREAAPKLGVRLQSIGVHDLVDFEAAFAAIESWHADALLTLVDPFTRQYRKRIVEFAAQRRLPAIYEAREFVEAGGLVSYGPSLSAIQVRAAEYIDKILKGAKPADLPVEQPAKFELLIDMKAAKALNLTIPASVMFRADEVIE